MKHQLLQEAEAMQEQLVTWRRGLHRIPETGTHLPQTVTFIKNQLDAIGVAYKIHEECSCITAELGKGEPCIMLRSDMDGLPIKEESGETFASENGCMHACGHDLHATVLLGAAKLLKDHEAEIEGTVKLLLQSGEETFNGAKAAIEAGVMENPKVDAAFAMHVGSTLNHNVIIYSEYPMSSVYGFKIEYTGKGTHGSTPEQGIDPLIAGANLCIALQELIAREISAKKEAALTIGKFQAGSASNVIPETAVIEGTLRTFEPEIREQLIARITEMAEALAKAYRVKMELTVLSDVPPVKDDPAMDKEAVASIQELDDTTKVLPLYHVMGSEDFAFFSEKVPSSYFCIGAGVEDKTKWVPHHNPKIVFNEKALSLGSAVYAKVAMDWVKNHKEN